MKECRRKSNGFQVDTNSSILGLSEEDSDLSSHSEDVASSGSHLASVISEWQRQDEHALHSLNAEEHRKLGKQRMSNRRPVTRLSLPGVGKSPSLQPGTQTSHNTARKGLTVESADSDVHGASGVITGQHPGRKALSADAPELLIHVPGTTSLVPSAGGLLPQPSVRFTVQIDTDEERPRTSEAKFGRRHMSTDDQTKASHPAPTASGTKLGVDSDNLHTNSPSRRRRSLGLVPASSPSVQAQTPFSQHSLSRLNSSSSSGALMHGSERSSTSKGRLSSCMSNPPLNSSNSRQVLGHSNSGAVKSMDFTNPLVKRHAQVTSMLGGRGSSGSIHMLSIDHTEEHGATQLPWHSKP